MNDVTLENSIKKVLESSLIDSTFSFTWHAGEPLAVGLEFYKKVTSLVDKFNIHHKKVIHTIQTNGTLINEKWCKFFKEFNFDIGVSVDGPAFLHDRHRKTWGGSGSHDKVLRGIKLLQEHNIPFRGICVLTHDMLDYSEEIFNFYLENGFVRLGFNIEEIEGDNKHSSLLKGIASTKIRKKYYNFMEKIYALWTQNKGALRIRELHKMSGAIYQKYKNDSYVFSEDEQIGLKILTIQKNGDISTFSPELCTGTPQNPQEFVIGNINELQNLEELKHNLHYLAIENAIKEGFLLCKKNCVYFDFCGGGAPSNKFFENGSFESTETIHCVLNRQTLVDLLLDKFSIDLLEA